ncbi:MAG TPA: AAA family ATPase [Longimicrobiaceae bacterium]|nr:AAA family ATPase [Longimicrobiaceae bacterium]
MYVEQVSISMLRSFRQAEIQFCHPDAPEPPPIPNVTLLLGDNGAGKTSVLRAIALAALAPVLASSSGFRPYRLVRRTRTEVPRQALVRGMFLLHGQDIGEKKARGPAELASTETRIVVRGDLEEVKAKENMPPVWNTIFQETSPGFLVVGYGASRRVESSASFDSSVRSKSRFVRYQRVSGLFEEAVTLTPLGSWLPEFRRVNKGRHNQVISLINRLLPPGTQILDQTVNGEYVFEHNGALVPFAALSDGYRAYIGWIADLLYHVCMGAPGGHRLDENRGIVLVDEIDLHLHPEWQRTVVPQLAKALPRLQFVLTSHSPLVVGTLHSANLRLIEADETGASRVKQLQEHVHGMTADQILVSSYFGLSTPRAPDAVGGLLALSQRARRGDHQAARDFLLQLSRATFTAEEQKAMAATDEATAEVPGSAERQETMKATARKAAGAGPAATKAIGKKSVRTKSGATKSTAKGSGGTKSGTTKSTAKKSAGAETTREANGMSADGSRARTGRERPRS